MRLIDAEALMGFARNHMDGKIDCNDIARFPAADALPVKHSHWVKCAGDRFAPAGAYGYCHLCHFFDHAPYNWCHGCGAKMDGGASDGSDA